MTRPWAAMAKETYHWVDLLDTPPVPYGTLVYDWRFVIKPGSPGFLLRGTITTEDRLMNVVAIRTKELFTVMG